MPVTMDKNVWDDDEFSKPTTSAAYSRSGEDVIYVKTQPGWYRWLRRAIYWSAIVIAALFLAVIMIGLSMWLVALAR